MNGTDGPRAVIFDLFGTLVDLTDPAVFDESSAELARELGLPAEPFTQLYSRELWRDRNAGVFPTIEASIAHASAQLGGPSDEAAINRATARRIALTRRGLTPRSDALATLRALHERGYRVGLISDCAPDVPLLWPETPFPAAIDAAVFSCVERCVKPEPRLYAAVCDRLAVSPERCIYVGDNIHELDGATRAGMRPVRIVAPHSAQHYPDLDTWQGARIAALSELLPLLGD